MISTPSNNAVLDSSDQMDACMTSIYGLSKALVILGSSTDDNSEISVAVEEVGKLLLKNSEQLLTLFENMNSQVSHSNHMPN